MSNPSFFEAPPTELTPGQVNRRDAKRRLDRIRQRRCRALKKWRAATANAPQFKAPDLPSEAEYCLVASLFIAHQFAVMAFTHASTEHIKDNTLRLIFGAALDLFNRGDRITRDGVVAELKRNKVLLIDGGALIDTILDLTPRQFSAIRVEMWAEEIKKAA